MFFFKNLLANSKILMELTLSFNDICENQFLFLICCNCCYKSINYLYKIL